MNQKQLVTSSDTIDLRLAADLYLSHELDTESEQLFVDRLAEPSVAQCLSDAIGFHAVGAQLNAASRSRDAAPHRPEVSTPARETRMSAWTVLAITASIAVCFVGYAQVMKSTEAQKTQRVAELWARVNATGLKSAESVALAGKNDTDVTSPAKIAPDAESSANGNAGPKTAVDPIESEGATLTPPSWLMTAAILSLDSNSGNKKASDKKISDKKISDKKISDKKTSNTTIDDQKDLP